MSEHQQDHDTAFPSVRRLAGAATVLTTAALGSVFGNHITEKFAPDLPDAIVQSTSRTAVRPDLVFDGVTVGTATDDLARMGDFLVRLETPQAGGVSDTHAWFPPAQRDIVAAIAKEGTLRLEWRNQNTGREANEGTYDVVYQGVCAVDADKNPLLQVNETRRHHLLGYGVGAYFGIALGVETVGAFNRRQRRRQERSSRSAFAHPTQKDVVSPSPKAKGGNFAESVPEAHQYNGDDYDFLSIVASSGDKNGEPLLAPRQRRRKNKKLTGENNRTVFLATGAALLSMAALTAITLNRVSARQADQGGLAQDSRSSRDPITNGQARAADVISTGNMRTADEWSRTHGASLKFEGCKRYVVNGEPLPLHANNQFDTLYSDEILSQIAYRYFSGAPLYAA